MKKAKTAKIEKMKVIWDNFRIQSAQTVILENVISVTLSNYSDKEVRFTHKGVERTLPGRNADLNVPIKPFSIEIFGHEFDAKIDIKFSLGVKDLIIDYSKFKNC